MAFEAAARNGSFTAAAQELNLTQGAVSRQVSALESQLNVRLFKRVRNSIQLTEAGKVYAEDVTDALKAIRNASLKVMNDPEGGILNLAILPTFGMRWLMPRFPDFLHRNPQITVNFTNKIAPFSFSDENLDAALHFGLDDWPESDCTYLMGERCVPVASPALASTPTHVSPNDLATLPLLHLETRPHAWSTWFEQQGIVPPAISAMHFEYIAMLTQAAVAGLGVALLPVFLIRTELDNGQLIMVSDIELKTPERYYIVSPAGASYAPVAALRNWLVEQTNSSSLGQET
jgi:DNA-binding transcriptional LysR family regulator